MDEENMIKSLLALPVGDPEEFYYILELIKRDNKFKMLVFAMEQGDINRIKSQHFDESTFEINGLADYSKEFIFDESLVSSLANNKQRWSVPVGHQFNIDLNIGKLINTFINKKRPLVTGEQYIIDYLLKETPKVPINIMSFIQERKTHKQNIKDKSLYQVLLSIAQFEKMRELNLKEIPASNECISIADKWWGVVSKNDDDLQQVLDLRYLVLYNFLLKVVYLQIKFSKKKESSIKRNSLLEFINFKLFIYPENEFWYALNLFSGKEFAQKIFNKFSSNKTAEDNIKMVKNMAWDLFHIRLTELILEEDSILYNKVVLPLFISEDKQLNNYIKFNPIKKIIFLKEKMYLARENNALEELTEEEYKLFIDKMSQRKSLQKKLSNDYLRKLSQELESDLLELAVNEKKI